ncbi:MAG: transposase [Actinomycetota bacterium]|nr:transposase [Actinomycetota bacterium]
MAVEGAMGTFVFETHVEHFHTPTLDEVQVIVIDNLRVHKSKRGRGEPIEAKGQACYACRRTRRALAS